LNCGRPANTVASAVPEGNPTVNLRGRDGDFSNGFQSDAETSFL